MSRREGFTLVEVLLAMAVVGILVRIAVPNVDYLLTQARAAEVMAEIAAVRQAAYEHLTEHHVWPQDTPAGTVPDELVPYLGEAFTFERDGYTLDWEAWELPAGLPNDPERRRLAGVTVVADDPALTDALRGLTGDGPWFALGDAYTFLIAPD